jgi:hypothetical protein
MTPRRFSSQADLFAALAAGQHDTADSNQVHVAVTRTIHTDVSGRGIFGHWNMEPDTHGWEAALLASILIREDPTQRGKCCVSSSCIRAHSSLVRVSPFMAPIS